MGIPIGPFLLATPSLNASKMSPQEINYFHLKPILLYYVTAGRTLQWD